VNDRPPSTVATKPIRVKAARTASIFGKFRRPCLKLDATGAAALIIASNKAVKEIGLTPRARVVAAASSGVEPRVMGIGPVPATRKLLDRLNLSIDDMDVIELNEAFAAQGLAVLRQLQLSDDAEHVNPNGGAIALGHPLGMSGARLVLTAVRELERRQARRALCTMCIGVGQGIAAVIERV
jgi:acetyl-CoA acetyltransferase family protein